MEPFSPQDPLAKLLGKARSVTPRPNFTQNVMRSVRQLPQSQSGWERLSEWFDSRFPLRPVLAAACAVMLAATMVGFWLHQPATISIALAENSGTTQNSVSVENDVATDLDQMEQLSTLLAQQDTSAMSDSDLAILLN